MKNYKITKAYYTGYGARLKKMRGTTQEIIVAANSEESARKIGEEKGFVETGGLSAGYIVTVRRAYKS
jgi:hypothetical protein